MKIHPKEYWDKHSAAFDSIYTGRRNPISKALDRLLRKDMFQRLDFAMGESEPIRGKAFLDAGCGSGLYTLELARKGASRAVGIDISSRMLDLARERLRDQPNVEFLEVDLLDHNTEVPYDVCLAMGFFDYTENAPAYLQRLLVLAREKVILSFPRKGTLRSFVRRLRLRVLGINVYFYSKPGIERLARDSGFALARIVKVGQLYCATIEKRAAVRSSPASPSIGP